MDIHHYERKYQSALKSIQNSDMSDRNKELILDFRGSLVLDGLSKPRMMRYMDILRNLVVKLNKDLDKATENDLKTIVAELQQSTYSPWTKQTYKVMIRRFYKWLYKTPGKDFPEIVSWISIRMSRSEMRLPSEGDLLKEEDIIKIINTAENPRDKAFISVLWESGARIGEIGNMKLKNVVFDEYGLLLTVRGKTGSRKIRLIASTPYISTWIANHPDKENKDAPLWVNVGTRKHNEMMVYGNMKVMLRNIFKKAGIRKRCNPHMFRHSRATFMANHLTEFQMNQYFGWIQGSDMPATYVHMSGREVDDAIMVMNGLKPVKKKEDTQIQPIICPRCDTINTAESKHCNKCGGILDIKTAMELEDKREKEKDMRKMSDNEMDDLFKREDVQDFLYRKMKEIKEQG